MAKDFLKTSFFKKEKKEKFLLKIIIKFFVFTKKCKTKIQL
jgi:hypothetical protein